MLFVWGYKGTLVVGEMKQHFLKEIVEYLSNILLSLSHLVHT